MVANALAISGFYPQTRCAIELGGADMAEICRPESTGPLAQAWTWLKDGIGAVVEYFR